MLAAVLLVNALLHPTPLLWPLYVVAAGVAALAGLNDPRSTPYWPASAPHDQLAANGANKPCAGRPAPSPAPRWPAFVVAYAGNVRVYATTVVCFCL
ncbi:hypothetical protein LV779_15640 [Streptomyces thinghirensis]|nr:hypothetical protein [Streptomyces thinghirensis]